MRQLNQHSWPRVTASRFYKTALSCIVALRGASVKLGAAESDRFNEFMRDIKSRQPTPKPSPVCSETSHASQLSCDPRLSHREK